MTQLPHFAAPFAFGPDGAVNVVEQDSPEEIAGCVFNIASCPAGFLPHDPGFGIEDLSFSTAPVDTVSLVDAIGTQEPRASVTASEAGGSLDTSLREIVLRVASKGGTSV